jgi:hypothetical protein
MYACTPNYNGTAEVVYKFEDDRDDASSGGSGKKRKGLSRAAFWAIVIAIPVPLGLGFWIGLIWWLCVRHKKKKAAKPLNGQTMANVPLQQGQGPPPVTYYSAPPPTTTPQPYGGIAQPYANQPYANQPYGNVERKPLAVSAINDQASSLTVGERDRDGVVSSHSSISRDSRTAGGLERREEELRERERMIEEMERERRAEELNARERALADREREIRAWDEQRKSRIGRERELDGP